MRSTARLVVVVLLALAIVGCGSGGNRPRAGLAQGGGEGGFAQVVSGSCGSGDRLGRPYAIPCVFVLSDGRRFSCPPVAGMRPQTLDSLQRSRACRPIAPLHLNARTRRVIAAVAGTRTCLSRHGYRTLGGPVLPGAVPADASSPDGELIVGNASVGPFLAFYLDAARATRLAPAIVANARRIHATVQRHGTVTILWLSSTALRRRAVVLGCLAA